MSLVLQDKCIIEMFLSPVYGMAFLQRAVLSKSKLFALDASVAKGV